MSHVYSKFLAMVLSDEECAKFMIPHSLRDVCAHLWVPYNKCLRRTYYLPFLCKQERHQYEACQYREYSPFLFRFMRRRFIYAIKEKEGLLVNLD